MIVSDFIVSFLKQKEVTTVFDLSGGMIMQLIDSFYKDGSVNLISVHHEQTAAFSADAIGRLTGKPGVAIATSGPGATNLITGIGSCFFDSSPALFITGQVNRNEQKGNKNIRQLGFQETDIVSMVRPITKFAKKIEKPEEVAYYMNLAWSIAIDGRPGPVLIDIPMDIFRSSISMEHNGVEIKQEKADNYLDKTLLDQLINDLKSAHKPIFLIGGGVNASGSAKLFRRLIEKIRIPVVNSLLAVDVLPYNHEQRVGLIGTYGNRWANISLFNSDLLIVVGSRLDIRQTGADTLSFKGRKQVYHIDCDLNEINNRVTGCRGINVDIGLFLNEFEKEIDKGLTLPDLTNWVNDIKRLHELWPDTDEVRNIQGINPNYFMHQLSKVPHDFSSYIVDVGQHQMWAAQSVEVKLDQRFITSGGMGAMGFALSASIGAAIITPGRPVCVIAGDAGFQVNIQELQTIIRNNLATKIVVINNNCHGMTRQFQETYFEGRYRSTVWGYSAPDFSKVANAYGIDSMTIQREEEIGNGLFKLSKFPDRPFLLQVIIDTKANVYPKMAFGLPMSEMEPFAKPLDMEST